MLFKIACRIKRLNEIILKKYYQKLFWISQGLPDVDLGSRKLLDLTTFLYFDQNEEIIQNLSKYFVYKHFFVPFDEQVKFVTNKKVVITENNQYIVSSHGLHNDWIYMISTRVPENYSLSFNITLLSNFKEFQVAFRHISLFKRLRFRIVDLNTIVFEIVNKGVFFNSFIARKFSFELNRMYNFQIVVNNNRYVLLIDNVVELSICSKCNDFKNGDLAIVFWDDKEKSNINAIIDSLSIYNII